ncbi:hypothetical protein RFI_08479 [Reticulomyxa filosa]|uniref:Uncharacterized protein n=1 Tax=Reticulomyxa filosa TaxID=46433 RepID=X6NRJ8_RETFI|nr:hypothetical protein RFI_08479 [Reticulomyxa filosa]|eukprot:ETO28651.1 hypothetical protein RFI_08479 [Reticulomyxa filosa]
MFVFRLRVEPDNKDDLKNLLLELDNEERAAINTKKKLHRYNPNTRKYVTEFMGDRMLRLMQERDESGRMIKNTHQYGKLYEQWQNESKRKIGVIGEVETSLPKVSAFVANDTESGWNFFADTDKDKQVESSSTDAPVSIVHQSLKGLGLPKFRHIKGTPLEDARSRAKKRRETLKNELKSKEKIKQQRVGKMKREQFQKWWEKNKDRVKKRKSLRRKRPF